MQIVKGSRDTSAEPMSTTLKLQRTASTLQHMIYAKHYWKNNPCKIHSFVVSMKLLLLLSLLLLVVVVVVV